MKKKLVMIQPNSHKVYWGWYKYLDANYDFYLIVPQGNGEIPFLKNKVIFLDYQKGIDYVFWKYKLGFFINLKNLDETLKKIKPDFVMSKIFHQPYTQVAYNYAKKNHLPFTIIEEQFQEPLHPVSKVIFYPFKKYLVQKLKSIPIISVTKQSEQYMKKIGFSNVRYNITYKK